MDCYWDRNYLYANFKAAPAAPPTGYSGWREFQREGGSEPGYWVGAGVAVREGEG